MAGRKNSLQLLEAVVVVVGCLNGGLKYRLKKLILFLMEMGLKVSVSTGGSASRDSGSGSVVADCDGRMG